jgi:hypothetical protein
MCHIIKQMGRLLFWMNFYKDNQEKRTTKSIKEVSVSILVDLHSPSKVGLYIVFMFEDNYCK